MKYTLAFILIISAYAGVEYLAFDLGLEWYFPSEDEITFDLYVPLNYREAFGWIGLAFQDARDARDKFACDYYIALLEDGLMTDRYAEANGFSKTDEDQGCVNDLTTSSEELDKYLKISFTRKLETGDRCDIVLHKDKPLMVKFAIGPVIDGNIEQHSFRYNGIEYIVLSEEYEDTNNDERFVYGPWMTHTYLDQKWYEEYGSPIPPETSYAS